MIKQNDMTVKSIPISSGAPLRVCFMPCRDTSLRSLVSEMLFFVFYSMAAAILFFYIRFQIHGVWLYFALLGQLILHVYLTTEILVSKDDVERIAGYGLMRREGIVRFCGYAPRRRRLRTVGLPICSVKEVNSSVLVYLSDDSQVQLPKLSLEGQRLFKSVFESMSAGADVKALREKFAGLAPGLFVSLEYKETPRQPKWSQWVALIVATPGIYVGWKLSELLFGR